MKGEILRHVSSERREILGQLLRFGLTGGFVTILGATVYAIPATFFGVEPLIANVFAYLTAAATGYVLHSRWSFRGHGTRDSLARTGGRFMVVSLISFALNSLWVWTLTDVLKAAPWVAVIPMIFVTPFVTFALNRRWVFA